MSRLLLGVAAVLLGLPGAAAAESVTMEATSTTVAVGGSTTVTARAPVTRTPGVASQEIIQRFDPAQLSLVGASGIRYPEGWSLSYSTDGTAFTQTAPANALAWLMVRAVKVTGTVDSEGATAEGYQISEGEATIPVPVGGSFNPTGQSGDGYDVIFDGESRIFNIFHHNGNGSDYNVAYGIDCRTRTGAVCWTTSGAQRLFFNVAPLNTTTAQSGWVDRTREHLWFPTSYSAQNTTGFACVDLSPLASTSGAPGARPTWCGGSLAAAYRVLGNGGAGTQSDYNRVTFLSEISGRLYTWEADTGKLLCLDTAANGGAGAACPGQPYAFSGITSAGHQPDPYPVDTSNVTAARLLVSDGRLYGMAFGAGGTQYAICFDPSTGRACTGWAGPRANPNDSLWSQMYEQPNADGGVDGICFAKVKDAAVPASGWPTSCWTPSGTTLTPNPDLLRLLSWGYATTGFVATNPIRVGSRVYATNALGGGWGTFGPNVARFTCWDVATDAACPGFPFARGYAYSLTVDSENGNCFWTNSDAGVIASFDALGRAGCALPPPTADLDAQTLVPRMACQSSDSLREWRSLRLTSPATTEYTRSTLTVLLNGRVVVSNGIRWENIPIPRSGQRLTDLTDLLVADSGTQPTFRIRLSGRSGTQPVTAIVQAVGDAPELCLPLVAKPICPAAPTVLPAGDLPLPSPSTVMGDGAASITGGGTETFQQGTQAIQV
ncbi:MAG: hypothetical protein ACR2J9_05880, partial [Gaiellales bacterium]